MQADSIAVFTVLALVSTSTEKPKALSSSIDLSEIIDWVFYSIAALRSSGFVEFNHSAITAVPGFYYRSATRLFAMTIG